MVLKHTREGVGLSFKLDTRQKTSKHFRPPHRFRLCERTPSNSTHKEPQGELLSRRTGSGLAFSLNALRPPQISSPGACAAEPVQCARALSRYTRLLGDEGYAALHPELKDVSPEDYPDIHNLAILADAVPYSREYNTYRQKIGRQALGNTELEIEYEKILARVKKTRESVIRMTYRHYTEPVDEISGTVESASPGGITLKEYPGRRFQFSSVSTSAADMSARILGEKNDMTRCLRPAGHTTPRAPAPEAPCL